MVGTCLMRTACKLEPLCINQLDMPEENDAGQFSELSIGVRELFRIVVPGAYALVLLEWLSREEVALVGGEGKTLSYIALSVLAGLIAYGLQVHEKWFPYTEVFRHNRDRLNRRIVEVAQVQDSKDYVYEYKYFLETSADIRDRIHYFSSFYYMLDEMSLISVVAAVGLIARFFDELHSGNPISTYFVLVALVWQLGGFYRGRREKPRDAPSYGFELLGRWLCSWIGIVVAWFLWNVGLAILSNHLWPRGPVYQVDWRFWALMAAAVIFERLGAKQWKSIINEQMVLVRDKKDHLKKVMDASTPRRHEAV